MTRDEYVERVTGRMLDMDPYDVADEVRDGACLTGVYPGRSERIHRLLRIAYWRGVRRGASLSWDAQQSVTLRDEQGETR